MRLTSDNLNLSAGRHLSEGVADPAYVKLGGAERQMPLAAYFRNVGAALLALLFVANCGMLRVNDDTFCCSMTRSRLPQSPEAAPA